MAFQKWYHFFMFGLSFWTKLNAKRILSNTHAILLLRRMEEKVSKMKKIKPHKKEKKVNGKYLFESIFRCIPTKCIVYLIAQVIQSWEARNLWKSFSHFGNLCLLCLVSILMGKLACVYICVCVCINAFVWCAFKCYKFEYIK